MPVRQALNAVYARCVRDLGSKERKEFDDELYGWTERNARGNDVLRDIREADSALNHGGDPEPPAGSGSPPPAVGGVSHGDSIGGGVHPAAAGR